MRRTAFFVALAVASSCASASTWTDLWSTREQQAQRLLPQHPDEAAKLFSDPRRRAYAELAAGHNAQAAELLKPFSDANSQYNRGNALARAGQLKDALSAYDSALKQAPQDADIRHNRDLVARALEGQKPPPQQQNGQNGQNGQNKDQQDKGQKESPNNQGQANSGQGAQDQNRQAQNGQGQNQNQNQNKQGGAQQPSAGSNGASSSQGSSQDSHQAQQAQQGAGSSQSSGAQQAQNQQGQGSSSSPQSRQAAAGQNGANSTAGQNAGQNADQDAREAQADAAAGAQYLREHPDGKKGANAQAVEADDARRAARGDAQQKPPSEASLALDQWLQRIPEDSGELLRRKFRIEYNMRHPQQYNEQDNER